MSANTDRLRAQLIAEKAFYKYDYGNSALDPFLTESLIKMLDSKGITDIRNIAFFDGIVPMMDSDGNIVQTHTAYYWNAANGKIIDGLGGVISQDPLKSTFAQLANDDYIFTFWIRYTPQKVPYFLIQLQKQQHQSLWMQVREVLPVIMAVVSLAIPGLGAAVGQTLLGSLASTYPAIATAVGNAAVGAATNGGDIEKAVISSLGSFSGAQVASVTSQFTDIDAFAKAAGAVTSAAVTGGDLGKALLFSGLQSGASLGNQPPASAPTSTGANTMGDLTDPISYSDFTDASVAGTAFDSTPAIFDNSPVTVDFSGVNVDVGAPDGTTASAGDLGTPAAVDASGVDWNKVISTVSQVAITALKVLPAFTQAGRPAIRVGSTSTNADGSVTTVAANGTITTHYPNGRTSTAPTAVGQPYFLTDGSTIINNGDGTYQLIRANGQSTTMRYSSAANLGGILSSPLVWGAAGIAALITLRR